MLAQSAEDVGTALAELGEAALEYKLDGARIQVHKSADRVAVYSRGANDVTAAVPEVVEAVSALPARELILDGEVLSLTPDGAAAAVSSLNAAVWEEARRAALSGGTPDDSFLVRPHSAGGRAPGGRATKPTVQRIGAIGAGQKRDSAAHHGRSTAGGRFSSEGAGGRA